LGPRTKRRKYRKNQKNIFGRNKKNNSSKKRCQSAQKIAKNWLRRFKNTKIEI
jgi:hypothetical protein